MADIHILVTKIPTDSVNMKLEGVDDLKVHEAAEKTRFWSDADNNLFAAIIPITSLII